MGEAAHLCHLLFAISGNNEFKASTRTGAHFSSGFLYSQLKFLSLCHSSPTSAMFRSQRRAHLRRQVGFLDQSRPSKAPGPSILPREGTTNQECGAAASALCYLWKFILHFQVISSFGCFSLVHVNHSTPLLFRQCAHALGEKRKMGRRKKFLNFPALQHQS